MNPDGTAQLQQHSNFWITLQPHAAYNGSICLRHTFHLRLQQGNRQRLRSVVVIPIEEKKIIFEKQLCTHAYSL
jgi:hypothetical protein